MIDKAAPTSPQSPAVPELTLDIEQRSRIFAALADPTRLRIVELLSTQFEMSGSEIAQHLGISLALFCHHNKVLTESGVIQIRKEGQTKYASLNQDLLAECCAAFQTIKKPPASGRPLREI